MLFGITRDHFRIICHCHIQHCSVQWASVGIRIMSRTIHSKIAYYVIIIRLHYMHRVQRRDRLLQLDR